MATSKIARSVVEAIIAVNYMANEEQIVQLAHDVARGEEAEQCYFRVLLAHMQSKLGTSRRTKQPPQEPVLDAIHEKFYPVVLASLGPEDMDKTERNRLGTKYRSAASTIRYFIRHGGDVRGVEVATATKTGIRNAVKPPEPSAEEETRSQRAFRRAQEALVRTAQRLARGDPDEARERLEATMEALEKLMDTLPAQPDIGGQTTTIVAGRAGVGGRVTQAPAMLHRGA
jgi:hypothetical protein